MHALATLAVALSPNVYMAVPAMMLAGMALISTANVLGVSAQMALPNWVRARGMSIYQMSIMGGTAAGAALWGQVASMVGVRGSSWWPPPAAWPACCWCSAWCATARSRRT